MFFSLLGYCLHIQDNPENFAHSAQINTICDKHRPAYVHNFYSLLNGLKFQQSPHNFLLLFENL